MKKRETILVTGAGGFIGHHLARFLKKRSFYVRGVDIVYPQFSDLSDFHDYRILDLRGFRNCIEATQGIDKVYALAAQNGSIEYTTTNRADLLRDNATINLNTAEACIRSGVKRLFFSSSACVYPLEKQTEIDSVPLVEEDVYPANAESEYGWEKLFSERMYKSYEIDYGLEVRIARFFNIYGPECSIDTLRSKAPMALTRKVIKAGNGGIVKIWGDGKQVRSFCYITDCVEAIFKLMESNIKDPINIGTADHISINELVDIICRIERVKVKRVYQLHKVQGVRGRLCNFSKAAKLLDWKAKVKPMQGMKIINKFVHEELGK
ncbi:MAG: NAD-dependent epimerase/dehydratase family protein [Patescibacteria group bacterium]|nr:NAD-dependent epimerase/dehydratase family protein [Actinomycetota bacterium]MCL5438477.1 NAD-dependent epimerase/dehydratase family protein [Patescibacteria group bacterium]